MIFGSERVVVKRARSHALRFLGRRVNLLLMRLLIALLPCLVVAELAAQQPTNPNLERVTNDIYTRSHDFDLVHERIAVSNFNWDSTSFTGRVAVTLVARRSPMDSVILDAGELLRVKSVTGGGNAALRTSRQRDTLVVFLATSAAFGDTVRFTIDYDGKVNNGRGLTFINERPHTPRQIWSQGEDMDNHLWFPTYDFPNDKMTWELDATVPAGYTAVSNGTLVGSAPSGSQTTFHWNQASPSATYLVSLVVAPLAKVHDAWGKVPVDAYVYRQDSALARPLFHVTSDMIDVYSKLTGVPYPWAKYAQTTVADFFGGMENVSATTLVDWLPAANNYQDRPWYQHIHIPHELAHQWFGDYVTTENWANMWLNEGFAEFMPGKCWGAKRGRHAADDYYLDEYRQYLEIDARRRMPLAALGSNNIYPKGALVLRMLREYLGPERFWAALHRYLVRHALDNATSDDLRQAVLDATGENLDGFWNEWVYGAGHPAFTVTAVYDTAARTLALSVKQTQRDSVTGDSAGPRYHTAAVFHMPLSIRVGTPGGDVVRRVPLTAREQTISFPALAGPPTMVVFADGNAILKELTFDQPTSWLATQLEHDADLWNREWVIEQLAQRPADAAALAALARAATSADYFLTRAQPAEALARFPPAGAATPRSEEHTSELQSRFGISHDV